MPRSLTGARLMSVMIALRGSFGSISPYAAAQNLVRTGGAKGPAFIARLVIPDGDRGNVRLGNERYAEAQHEHGPEPAQKPRIT